MQLTRQNALGLIYSLSAYGDGQTQVMLVDRKTTADPVKRIVVNVRIEEMSARWYRWQMRGEFIQNAFDVLTPDEREFLMTGITATEWKEIFRNGEETDRADTVKGTDEGGDE